jgi:bifunctional UDP-N-acetylglucosamine pyrophosphorylase / glucosamine-1-phosphate N-acetyltransferase
MGQLLSIILATGQGTGMKSNHPKVLHKILGRPMIQYVVDAARGAGSSPIVIVVAYEGEQVMEMLGPEYQYVWHKEPPGTGRAVMATREYLKGLTGDLLVLYGDMPLIREQTLIDLVALRRNSAAAVAILTTGLNYRTGYGKIIRNGNGDISDLIEFQEASTGQNELYEVNTGVYCFEMTALLSGLAEISPGNKPEEYCLTEVFKTMLKNGEKVAGLNTEAEEVMVPNDRVQLAQVENLRKVAINQHWMEHGVTIWDPSYTYIGPEVDIGRDTVVLPGTIMMGKTTIGRDCVIGPHSRIIDSAVGDGTEIQYSQVVEARLGRENKVGPFAYLRPGTVSEAKVKFGDFVEIKNVHVGEGTKVPHLTYLGDAEVGSGVNIGAGTITCNYNGVLKQRTTIKDGAFVGSHSTLVAPVVVGTGSYVAAGSTITSEIPDKALGIGRSRQENKVNWCSPRDRTQK